MAPAVRMCVPAWLITAAVAGVSLGLGPPSRLGTFGWVAACTPVLLFLVVGLVVRTRGERTSNDELLALSYLAVVGRRFGWRGGCARRSFGQVASLPMSRCLLPDGQCGRIGTRTFLRIPRFSLIVRWSTGTPG